VFTEGKGNLAGTAAHGMGPFWSYFTAPLVPQKNGVNDRMAGEKEVKKIRTRQLWRNKVLSRHLSS
jgi:hypothetical protein